MVTPAARREAAAHLRSAHQMSERRACRVVGADRSCVRYQARRPDDVRLRARLRNWRLSAALWLSPAVSAAPAGGAIGEQEAGSQDLR